MNVLIILKRSLISVLTTYYGEKLLRQNITKIPEQITIVRSTQLLALKNTTESAKFEIREVLKLTQAEFQIHLPVTVTITGFSE